MSADEFEQEYINPIHLTKKLWHIIIIKKKNIEVIQLLIQFYSMLTLFSLAGVL
jgi:hypothetical protein